MSTDLIGFLIVIIIVLLFILGAVKLVRSPKKVRASPYRPPVCAVRTYVLTEIHMVSGGNSWHHTQRQTTSDGCSDGTEGFEKTERGREWGEIMQTFGEILCPDAILWRYVTFDKFKSMLETKSLYLRRSDSFEDPLEGVLPEGLAKILDQRYPLPNGEKYSEEDKKARKFMFVSCWQNDEQENCEMWKEYANLTDGVLIRTNLKSLERSLPTDDRLSVGTVFYDRETLDISILGNQFRTFFLKDRKFQNEKEFRIVLFVLNEYNGWNAQVKEVGRFMQVDLDILIKVVIVAPKSNAQFFEKVSSLCREHLKETTLSLSSLA